MRKSIVKVGVAGALLIGPFMFLPHLRADLPLTILSILLIFVAFPLFLLSLIDMSRTLPNCPYNGPFPRAVRVIFSALHFILGVLAIIFGVTIILWFVYNVFIERLPEFTGINNFNSFGMAIAMITVGVYWLFEAFGKQKQYHL
ncbi:MAG: hypothetical protein ACE5EP_03930 [Candidatus Methylomirabilales bacterium]